MLHGAPEKITGRGGPSVHFVNEWLSGGCGFIPLHSVSAALAACSGMSSRGNRSLLEAIAFPTVRENIVHGRLRGYYFNTFLLTAERGGCVLGEGMPGHPLLPILLSPQGWAVTGGAGSPSIPTL